MEPKDTPGPPGAANEQRVVRLPDGRSLGYAEFGDSEGAPVFVLHGNPGSRLDILYAGRSLLAQLPARVIAPDRPGIGLSSPQQGRTLADWAQDLDALADALGVGQYCVLGASTGGPYALACARFRPQRIAAVGLMSSIGPPDAPAETRPGGSAGLYFRLARLSPWLLRTQLWLMAQGLRDPQRMIKSAMGTLPAPDQAYLSQPEVQEAFLATLAVALRSGPGLALDATLAARPWGFRLEDIPLPVTLWHGEADRNAPIATARYLAQAIPQSSLRTFAGEGHFSLIGRLAELVGVLTGK